MGRLASAPTRADARRRLASLRERVLHEEVPEQRCSLNLLRWLDAGCTALPDIEELEAQLREAGFAQVRRVKLMPFDPFYGLAATV